MRYNILAYFLLLFVTFSSPLYAEENVTKTTNLVVKTVLPDDIKTSSSSVKIVYLLTHTDLKVDKSVFLYIIPFFLMPLYILLVYLFFTKADVQIVENKFGLITYHKKIKIRHIDDNIRDCMLVGLAALFFIWMILFMVICSL